MKSTTKFFQLIVSVSFMVIALMSCDMNKEKNQSNTTEKATEQFVSTGEIHAYYFHATRRCATCEAVEAVTSETLKTHYGEKVTFKSINRDEDKSNPLIEKYKINGQTLLIVKDGKVINLTNDAFLNARTKPETLEAKLKETIDAML